MDDRLLRAGWAACERRGYVVSAPDHPRLPPAVAEAGTNTASMPTPVLEGSTATTVALEPLDDDELTPTMLLSRLRNNRGHDRFSLFLVESVEAAQTCHTVLRDPPLVASETADGGRTFYNGPDRIALVDGGFAAVRTDTAAFTWREEGDGDDRHLVFFDNDSDEPVVVLGGIDELSCPPASAFPYAYARDTTDKRLHVWNASGRRVGIYNGVAAMRANAYVPVPMPLVPEHVFDGLPSVRDEWAILVVGDGSGVEGRSDEMLFTADDTRYW